jgi:hypothetical protein
MLVGGLPAPTAFAQASQYNHPELRWRTFQTEHFVFYYHQGEESTVPLAAKIAEEVYDPITDLYQYEPDGKVHFIFKDTDDIANAATYYNDNKIVFWASAMDFELRGTHHWLRNVITHEFTHVIQLGASRKWTRRLPAFYLQVLAYEEERRPDVLYGYPNVLSSYAVPGLIIPGWFAEGTAQTQNPDLGHDYWDSQRDMLLRARVLGGTMLTYDQMGVFEKNSLDAESVYNHGFGLVLYIMERWGKDALRNISQAARSPLRLNFDGALKKVTGLTGQELHDEWCQHLKETYTARTATIQQNRVEGRKISESGFVNLSPVFSPDGSKVAYFSNGKRPYWSQTNLTIYTLADSSNEAIAVNATSGVSWSPDSRFLAYARRARADIHGSRVYDIFVWDTEREKEFKLTNGLRTENPSFSPDGSQIACTINRDGARNLAVIDLPDLTTDKPERLDKRDIEGSARYHPLTQFHSQTEVSRPRWSPDGSQIVFAITRNLGRDICLIPSAGGPVDTLLDMRTEVRDPMFSADGTTLYYASDQTGIFNIYAKNLQTGESVPVTNVIGGALMPDVHGDSLVFANFTAHGYTISVLEDIQPLSPEHLEYIPDYETTLPSADYHDKVEELPPTKAYKPSFMGLTWLPRIAWDYGSFKPGFYLYSSDFLEKFSVLGGFAINTDRDHDLFAQIEFRGLPPTLFAEAYNIVRNRTYYFADSTIIVGETNQGSNPKPIYDKYRIRYRYNLTELDFGLRYPLSRNVNLQLAGIYSRYVSHNKFDDGTAISLTYLRGWAFQATFRGDFRARTLTSNIQPESGREITLQLTRENNKFFREFEIDADRFTLQEAYAPYNYNRFYGSWVEYRKLPYWEHAMSVNLWGGFIDREVDDFFDYYAGGMHGMRGYSFYSLGGRKMLVGNLTYRFPILRNLHAQKANIYLHHVYGSLFADYGDAWDGSLEVDDFKADVGANLRLFLTSFYVYPTALEFSAAYGLDKFTLVEGDYRGTYGEEWRFYLSLLFEFINSRNNRLGYH